jgi:hypothetical protein
MTTPETLWQTRPGALSRRHALQQVAVLALAGLTLAASGSARATTDTASAAQVGVPLPAELTSALPAAHTLGTGRLRFLGMGIYDARLWVSSGFNASAYAQSPLALELGYLRSLSGKLIAERSLKEMRRQGSLPAEREQAWLQAMQAAFPDVNAGDRITGLHTPGVGARFWFNGQPRPAVPDAEFSRLFFGIWLSDVSSEPQMRERLLGRSPQ